MGLQQTVNFIPPGKMREHTAVCSWYSVDRIETHYFCGRIELQVDAQESHHELSAILHLHELSFQASPNAERSREGRERVDCVLAS